MPNDVRVSALFIHPLKSAASIAVDSIELDQCGAVNDRRWMLVDDNGTFLTQREIGALALIHPAVHEDGLILRSAFQMRRPGSKFEPIISLSTYSDFHWHQ